MAHLTPIRDAAGGIIGLQPKGESQFAATLADTMAVVGAVEPAEQSAPPAAVRSHLAMIVGGLVAALALVAALNVLQTPTGRPIAPTAALALPTATIAPTAAPSPTSTPTAVPEPPTPIVIVQPAPPPIQCYTIEQDVTDSRGYPIGHVEGYSCESREAAQANAAAQAEQVKAAHEGR